MFTRWQPHGWRNAGVFRCCCGRVQGVRNDSHRLLPFCLLALGCGSSTTPQTTVDASLDANLDASPDANEIPTAPDPEFRFVTDNQTFTVKAPGQSPRLVIASEYSSPQLSRAWRENPWDLFDPVSGLYIAPFEKADGSYALFAVGDGAPPVPVPFDSTPAGLFEEPPAWGVMSADGSLIYLSTGTSAYVARRSAESLSFGVAVSVGFDVGLVHDISPNGQLAIASGHLPIKWGLPADVAAPRRMSIFEIADDGTFSRDVSADHAPLDDYLQMPTFVGDSLGLVYEGDDDIDTGDRLFTYRFGETPTEIYPEAVRDNDFNTPCAMQDGQIAFWESMPGEYLLRVYDPKTDETATLNDAWIPYSGYVRCR